MERNKVRDILIQEQYPDFMIEQTLNKIEKFNPIIMNEFEVWVETQKSSKLAVEGYDFSCLINQYGMKPVGAFITLDWLTRDPETAVNALKKGIR